MNNKIAIVTDTHFGTKKSSDRFLDSQMKFFTEEFIPYLKENNITTIVFGGDTFDSRNSINVKITNAVFSLFESLQEFTIYVIIGNHDIYYKTTTEVNSLKFLKKFDNVTLIENVTEIDDMLLVPWQVDEKKFTDYVIENKLHNKICIGHFDINGFRQTKSMNSVDGFSTKVFENFDIVFSGHFHLRDEQMKNGTKFIYVGAPYHLDRNDIGMAKGFCIVDTKTLEYEFVDNTTSIKYVSVNYPTVVEKSDIENNVVDVYVDYDENYNEIKFKEYLSIIDSYSPLECNVKLINNFLSGEEISELDDYDISNIESIIKDYIKGLDGVDQKEYIDKVIFDLYDKVKDI